MNPPDLNDLYHRAEALAQDLRALQENEKPEKWAKERAAHARGEPVQFNLPHVWNEEIWEDWLGRSAPDFERTDMKWRIKPSPEWTPRFKVGDRVQGKVTKLLIGTIIAIRDGTKLYEIEYNGLAATYSEDRLEPYVWTLSRHIPGFRPLEEGEQWHRDDFTEEMLPEGWRPLLKGENAVVGDQYLHVSETWRESSGNGAQYISTHYRTRRPLPDTERERFERAWNAGRWSAWSSLGRNDDLKDVAFGIWQAARKAQ